MSDRELLGDIRDVLVRNPFVGDGERKVWARLRSEHYQTEIAHLGIAPSPAFHCEPETLFGVVFFVALWRLDLAWLVVAFVISVLTSFRNA